MDSWERFNEESLPGIKAFYSKLKLPDITYENYAHAQKLFEELDVRMYLKTLETSVFNYVDLILFIFCLHLDYHGKPL